MRYTIPALLAAALLTGTGVAMACDSLGENMHMGQIVSIDRKDSSFVIRDAESSKPIRFSATQAALATFDVNDVVEVSYEVIEGGALRSVKLSRI